MALIDLWGDLITEYSLSLILVWVIMAMLVLYVGRIPCHNILKICSLSIGRIFRNFSKSAERNEKQINNRNREILLAYGRESSERYLERAFQRLAVQVNSQLGSYPGLHQKLSDQFKSIDEDYRRSADEPPRPPEWLKAIEAVAEIPANDSPVVASILGDIHKTMRKALDKNIVEYKAAIKERHLLLKKIKPYWVYLSGILKGLDGKIAGIDKRTRKIDEYMEKYESMLKDPDRAERVLTKSLFKDLVVSVFLLCIGISGIYVNFYLIALPMEEIVGAGSSLSNMKASDMAAIFLTGIEISIGIILMDALGLTRLFTSISDSADDRKKRFIIWLSVIFIFVCAILESSLAYIRDMSIIDSEVLIREIYDKEILFTELKYVPMIGGMMLGFIMPFVLVYIVIPLELFIYSLRIVIGKIIAYLMKCFKVVCFQLSIFIMGTGKLLIQFYDLIICLPLKLEAFVIKPVSKK